ncbi:hypothetical protein MVEN_01086700 [Mycena venus]|uniref:Uncharacterized protein n=1 Tax=Mycena venus TaxID=2733690 RepID=A0A8H6Y7S6_9AGAR|nr:hypothetical protein MVEN_01086700 [Mycena venus]
MAAHRMNPMKIPELIQEIAAFVENARDLSQLVQVDRFTNAAATPCLFRHIDITLDSVESLAATLRSNPERAVGCKSLSFHKSSNESAILLEARSLDQLSTDLITVFNAISAHGQLVTLRWRKNCRLHFGRYWIAFPENVWTAMSHVMIPLQELELCVNAREMHIWGSITCLCFTQLRVFRIYLPDAGGWNCSDFQTMLDSLCDLEELSLVLSIYDGPRNITLGSTYPHLRRFSFTSNAVFPASDFLLRHPKLEILFLEMDQVFHWPDPSTHSALRILNIDEHTLVSSPIVMNARIIHLRFRSSHLGSSVLLDTVRAVACTLRCLELEVYTPFEVGYAALLDAAPALVELGIICSASYRIPDWSTQVLCNLVSVLDPAAPLRALRLRHLRREDDKLPVSFLNDLEGLDSFPPRLEYIGWDFVTTSLIYVITKLGGKNSVSRTLTRSRIPEDWTEENVLHYLEEY